MLVNHTASKRRLRHDIRKQHLNQKELYKAMSVQVHTNKNYIKVLTNRNEHQVSKNKMMEGGN